jgi:hydrogenase nickel incorporation protein HypB
MCTTCGCSDQAEPRLVDLDADHEHSHPNHAEHSTDHSEHGHRHSHADGLNHDHHHEEQHAHSREHEHEHPEQRSKPRTIRLEQDLLAKNNLLAERNRGWLEGREILALNLMSSPGAGKTTLLERTLRDLCNEAAISVIEGDQETTLDAARIRAAGCPVIQINTGSGCHLDAQMIAGALKALNPQPHSLVMIENVGNLVCPALFDLGEAGKVVIMSVTEGEDKPLKYPHMFQAAQLMLLNKIDLLPHLNFEVARCLEFARRVNPNLLVLQLSAITGAGLGEWYSWLRERIKTHREVGATEL